MVGQTGIGEVAVESAERWTEGILQEALHTISSNRGRGAEGGRQGVTGVCVCGGEGSKDQGILRKGRERGLSLEGERARAEPPALTVLQEEPEGARQ